MRAGDQLTLGRRSLTRHPLRTALTMLGMVIGVASVILMVSLGLGARAQVENEIGRLGTHLLTVLAVRGGPSAAGARQGGSLWLSDDDARALVTEVAEVRYAVPVTSTRVQLVLGSGNWQTTVIGTHPEYLPIRDWETRVGRNFTMREVVRGDKVLLVGRAVAERLSPLLPVVGKVVRVNDVPFRVIGELAEKGRSMNGQDQDDIVVAPITTVKSRLGGGDNRRAAAYLLIKGRSTGGLDAIREQGDMILRARHGLASDSPDAFRFRDPVAALSASRTASEAMTLLLASVAAVSLLVGGISIMNIMLVSVTERAREIGIRVAVGATRSDILRQFLAESAGVALLGGLIGVIVGVACALIASTAFGWSTLVSAWACLGAVTFSVAVGVVSGLYPAMRASAMDPMEAIRQA